jgi:hypothetical protein
MTNSSCVPTSWTRPKLALAASAVTPVRALVPYGSFLGAVADSTAAPLRETLTSLKIVHLENNDMHQGTTSPDAAYNLGGY